MAGYLLRIHFAICALLILALSLSDRSVAQSNANPLIDSPSQRWLPPPSSYPNQPDTQAKLLSSLRDLVLNNSSSKEANPSRLSDSDVQSLKEAMKQYAGNLPDGLSADSLDAIPAELISKALSNPELMRQAKELSEQFMKKDRPKSSGTPSKPDDSASNGLPTANAEKQQPTSIQNKNEIENKFNSGDVASQSPNPNEGLDSKSKKKNDDFAYLMEKLKKTQQQFENGQNPSNAVPPPRDRSNEKQKPSDLNAETPKSIAPAGAKRPGTAQPGSAGANRSESVSRSGTMPSAENRSNSSQQQAERSRQSPKLAQDELGPFDSKQNQQSNEKQPTKGSTTKDSATIGGSQSTKRSGQSPRNDSTDWDEKGNPSADRSNDSKSTAAVDIRKELDRRGFGATLQKIIEEAQRSSQSSRVATQPTNGIEVPSKPTNIPNENVTKPAAPDRAKRSTTHLSNPASTADSPRKPAKSDSALSKSFQETGKYLNNLWTQISKSNQNTTATSPSPRSTPQASTTNEAFVIPNPFNSRVLEGLFVLAVAIAIAFFAFRYRFRAEQVRRELLESQLAPRIDEITTRDDVVRAFHALAKQRFQSAQAWWTYSYVTEQFDHALPEHATPIRTLSSLYEQARYFPMEHRLTTDQIEDAKFALKQCKG